MKFVLVMLFFFGCFSQVQGAETESFSESSQIIDDKGKSILFIGALSTLVAIQYDEWAKENWGSNKLMSTQTSSVGDFWGTGIPQALIISSQLAFDKSNGIKSAKGLLTSTLITYAGKFSIQRERPNKSNHLSMPSGHTQAAFALASAMQESYGWQTSVPFWGLAVLTGASRISDDAHWFSDVVAGATIGTFFGRYFFINNENSSPIIRINQGKVEELHFAFGFDY